MKYTKWIIPAFVLAAFAAGMYAYPSLPASIASHWNLSGQADD
ncbi:MAG: DUF1648 domain-containing protein [bacterium]|nr:DUF1648 domain-containing protein [bacterium]